MAIEDLEKEIDSIALEISNLRSLEKPCKITEILDYMKKIKALEINRRDVLVKLYDEIDKG